MSINFLTFGSHDNYIDAANRISNQAKKLNIFDTINIYTGDDLKNDNDFWDKHGTFIENNKIGYGYWIWKPYLIYKTIEKLNDGDLLLYLDSGCEICNEEKIYMLEHINFVKKYKILGTRTDKTSEYNCNKMDLINLFNINPEELDMFQIQATIVFLEVSHFFKNLIKVWYELACNYHYIDESPSIISHPNNKKFIVHRNDQSIFSLLIKKYNLYNLFRHELSLLCIKCSRNRSGIAYFN